MSEDSLTIDNLRFDERGLIPAIVQDSTTGEVLMLAYMNRESLEKTLETRETWFYSRSRKTLWNKGATSGNRQRLRWLRVDCDADTLLVGVQQIGEGACHIPGRRTCFAQAVEGAPGSHPTQMQVLPELARVIATRHRDMPKGSYTTELFEAGISRIAKKVGEEAVEVILAAQMHNADPESSNMAEEVADLLYHLTVLLEATDLPIESVFTELAKRRR